MSNFHEKLNRYAEIVVKIGLNIQKGQHLVISSPLEAAEFTRLVTKQAYQNGAKRVTVDWNDPALSRINLEEAPEDTLKEVPKWTIDKFKDIAENNGAILSITGNDPKAFEGVNPERMTLVQRANGEQLKFFQKAQLSGETHWAIVGVPTKAWAKMVFPDKNEDEAVADLWEAIFKTVRADKEDPVAAWEEHSKSLIQKLDYLNEKHFKTLHYKGPGTELSIDLHPDHIWIGGGHKSTLGTTYIPNLPTEEVFTAPRKYGVNGTVTSTKPLSYFGNMIEDFSLTFENGKVVDYKAEKGYEALKQMLNIDEGMCYLGEVALVPHDSPISNSGIIFNNTLYDENASCHVALGNAITMNIDGASKYSKEEMEEREITSSFGHVDFMIGSGMLDIDGETTDGERIPLFRNGNWAI